MSESHTNSDAYKAAVEKAALENVILAASSSQVSYEYSLHEGNVNRYFDDTVDELNYDDEERLLVGKVRCRVWINKRVDDESPTSDGPSELTLFWVKATYVVVFTFSESPTKETMSAFFQRIGPLSAWPYFRMHVAQRAAEACVDLPILPIKKLVHSVRSVGGYIDPDASKATEELETNDPS